MSLVFNDVFSLCPALLQGGELGGGTWRHLYQELLGCTLVQPGQEPSFALLVLDRELWDCMERGIHPRALGEGFGTDASHLLVPVHR